MTIHYTKQFAKSFKKLPAHIQKLAITQEDIFKKNPSDPRLHTKPLSGSLKGVSSFRVTREYRVLYSWKDKENVLFYEIGHRKWIYEVSVPSE